VKPRGLLLTVYIFSKFIHMNTVKTKSGPSVDSAFRSIFDDPKYSSRRRPIWDRNDRDRQFLNKHFQDMLRYECAGVKFQVYRNPDLKCAVVGRAHHTIRDSLYEYFTYKNTYIYMDDISIFVKPRRQAWRPYESPIRTCW